MHELDESAGDGREAEAFRNRIHDRCAATLVCTACGKRPSCFAGCPVMPLVDFHSEHLETAPTFSE